MELRLKSLQLDSVTLQRKRYISGKKLFSNRREADLLNGLQMDAGEF